MAMRSDRDKNVKNFTTATMPTTAYRQDKILQHISKCYHYVPHC